MTPDHLWRIDHWMIRHYRHKGLPMKNPFHYYFQKNIWLTTSGHFSTPDLLNAITAAGADRIMFSIELCSPLTTRCVYLCSRTTHSRWADGLSQFEDIEEAAMWWDSLQVNPMDKVNMVCTVSSSHLSDVFHCQLLYSSRGVTMRSSC